MRKEKEGEVGTKRHCRRPIEAEGLNSIGGEGEERARGGRKTE